MKIIYCIRHAKSSWEDYSLPDLERPLNNRGRRDAPVMAGHLSKKNANFDLLLLSPSKRTRETADYFNSALNISQITIKDEIYHATLDTLMETITDLSPSVNIACIIGHNPGMTYLYNQFSSKLLDNLPTCGIFCLKISAENWSDMDTSNTIADHLIYPKLYL